MTNMKEHQATENDKNTLDIINGAEIREGPSGEGGTKVRILPLVSDLSKKLTPSRPSS
jgi:hypothetical protein